MNRVPRRREAFNTPEARDFLVDWARTMTLKVVRAIPLAVLASFLSKWDPTFADRLASEEAKTRKHRVAELARKEARRRGGGRKKR